jgi:hypothetical protein
MISATPFSVARANLAPAAPCGNAARQFDEIGFGHLRNGSSRSESAQTFVAAEVTKLILILDWRLRIADFSKQLLSLLGDLLICKEWFESPVLFVSRFCYRHFPFAP